MFSAFVIVYLFLGGFGSGLLLIAAFASLVFHCALDCNEIEVAAFDEWRNRCFLWGFVIVSCGALCLLLDLGKPERFVMLFVAVIPVPASPSGGHSGIPAPSLPVVSRSFAPSSESVPAFSPATSTFGSKSEIV